MRDTALLLGLGTLTVIWWACMWGLLDAAVQKTRRPLLCYGLGAAVITLFVFMNPHIADRLL